MTIAEKIYHDGREEGKIEGKLEGKEEGRIEGRIEVMQEMIAFSIELKFGLISKAFAKNIKKINDYGKLTEIKGAVKSSDSLEELKEKLSFEV